MFIEKGWRVDSVILSVEQFELLKAAGADKSMAQHQTEFNAKYKDWPNGQNALTDIAGVFGEDFRP